MRLIDGDALIKRLDYCVSQGLGGNIAYMFKHMVDEAPTVEAIPTDWIIAYIKAKCDKVADMVKADGNEHEMGMEIVEATAINKILTDWAERKEE